MTARASFAVAAFGLLLSACGPDAFVSAIEINVALSDGDVDNNGALANEKNISTEQGNPYGKFLTDLEAEFGDGDVTIFLDSATITLEGDANVDAFEDLFQGEVLLSIVDDSSGIDVGLASVVDPLGAGPVELEINDAAFDDEAVQLSLREGAFKVKVTSLTNPAAGAFNINIVTSLSFGANE